MKKRFSRRHNSFVGAYPWVGPALVSLGVLVLVVGIFRFLLPGALVAVGKPFWSAGNSLSAGVGNVGSFFTDKAALTNERDALLRDKAALEANAATSAARIHDLEQLLGDRMETGNAVLAGVLARPPISPYDVLVIDQGSESGIAAGNRVQGPGGMPLGVVESVTGSSARVLLYTAPAKETESWIGEGRIPVTVVGEGAGSMSAEVARDAGVVVGDLVYMMGPGAVAVGSVVAVGNDPSSPRSKVDIRPLQNPFSITWVTVTP